MIEKITILQTFFSKNHYKEFIIPVDRWLEEDASQTRYLEYLWYSSKECIELNPKEMQRKVLDLKHEVKDALKDAIIELRNYVSVLDTDERARFLEAQKEIFISLIKQLRDNFYLENPSSDYFASFEYLEEAKVSPILKEMSIFKDFELSGVDTLPAENTYMCAYKLNRFLCLTELLFFSFNCAILFRAEIEKHLSKLLTNKTEIDYMEKVTWEGSKVELLEITKALIETGTIKGVQKDVIKSVASFFKVEIPNPDKQIHDITKRNNGSETLFLDRLKDALTNYINKR